MSDCDMCGLDPCPAPVTCKRLLRREACLDRWWNFRANLWGWLLGCGWGIVKKYPDWAFSNLYMEREPKVWAASIRVAIAEGKI